MNAGYTRPDPSGEAPHVRVCCTRPKQPSEAPHSNKIADALLYVDTHDRSMLLREEFCQVCRMPLILQGRYIPIRELGQGGFGRTFLAIDREFFTPDAAIDQQTQRVIKQFRSDILLLPGQLEQAERAFRREKNTLDQLKHGQIPRVYGYFRLQAEPDPRLAAIAGDGGSNRQTFFYLVQEYVRGLDLQQQLQARLANGQTFSESEVEEVLKQMLEVLSYVHQKGVIHRDIKPSNIVRSDEDGTYHLVDFGAVKQIIAVVEQGLSEGETHFFTRGFSPPEQYNGQVDFSSDLYSLAMTCISLLTGKTLTSSGSSPDDLRSLGLPYNHEQWRAHAQVSDRLAGILNRMLEPEQQHRFQSADEVLQALSAPPAAPPAPVSAPVQPLKPPTRAPRSKALPWVAGAAAIALLVGAVQIPAVQCSVLGRCAGPGSGQRSPVTVVERLSLGDRLLIPSVSTAAKQAGVAAFAAGDYPAAIAQFEASLRENPNDPETLIYLNNARLRAAQRETYKIATSVPIGRNLNVAQEILRGVAQAQDEINASGGISGLGLEVQVIDDSNDPAIAADVAEVLVQDEQVLAVVGHNTGDASLGAAPVYQQQGLVMISPTTFNAEVAEVGSYIFRAVPTPQSMVAPLLRRMLADLPQPVKVLVCYDSQAPDQTAFKNTFVDGLTAAGGEVVRVVDAENRDICDAGSAAYDPAAAIDQAIEQGANSLYLGTNVNDLEEVIQVARISAGRLPLFSSPTLYTRQVIQQGQEAINGLTLVVPWSPEAHRDNPFIANAERLWLGPVNWRTATAYDATRAVIAGLQQSSTATDRSSRDRLQRALQNPDFSTSGSGDPVRFLDTRNRRLNPVLVQVQPDGAGDYQFVQLPTPQ